MSTDINILRNIQHKKTGGLSLNSSPKECIAIVSRQGATKYINNDENSDIMRMEIDDDRYRIEAHIPLKVQRIISILSGESGSGKTLLAYLQALQYKKYHPRNRMFYICSTSYQDDENMQKLPLTQLDTENMDEYRIEDFMNSLLIFDDTDYSGDNKKIMKFLNKATETGRKFGVSIIFCTHIHSKLNASVVYKEAQLYTTFGNSLINNRMLENNLKIPKDIIEFLKSYPHGYITFNNLYKACITDNLVFKY